MASGGSKSLWCGGGWKGGWTYLHSSAVVVEETEGSRKAEEGGLEGNGRGRVQVEEFGLYISWGARLSRFKLRILLFARPPTRLE
jgi:hypothetical protein